MLEQPMKLRGDLICLSDLGGDPAHVLAGSGVGYDEILAHKPLSQLVIADLFDLLARRAPRDFAVRSSQALRVHHLGMLGYRLSNCHQVGDILQDWVTYSRMLDYPLGSRFTMIDSRWRMEFFPRFAMSAAALIYCYESTFAGFRRSVANMSAILLTIETCAFPFERPADAPDYNLIGARHFSFGHDCGYVEGPASELSQLIEAADPAVLKACDELCCAQLAQYSDTSCTTRIRGLLTKASVLPGLGEIAAMLGESPRSIQRKLACEGQSFHQLLDAVRQIKAMRLLERNVPAKMIAFQLGFKDVSSFRRVFRNWQASAGDNDHDGALATDRDDVLLAMS